MVQQGIFPDHEAQSGSLTFLMFHKFSNALVYSFLLILFGMYSAICKKSPACHTTSFKIPRSSVVLYLISVITVHRKGATLMHVTHPVPNNCQRDGSLSCNSLCHSQLQTPRELKISAPMVATHPQFFSCTWCFFYRLPFT